MPENTRLAMVQRAAQITAQCELLNLADMCSTSSVRGVRAIAEACLQRVQVILDGAEPCFLTPDEAARLAARIVKRLKRARAAGDAAEGGAA